ncbi:MAG: hypothetical protein QOF30_3040 [Acidimicrobiaceae bacterium]|jgi:hypothetical protein|nr:hypothetical protein [Acidimicrobiaceae bacterium]
MRPKRRSGGTEQLRHLFSVASVEQPRHSLGEAGEADGLGFGLGVSMTGGYGEEYVVEWGPPTQPAPTIEPADVSSARIASRNCHPAGSNLRRATHPGKIA